MNKELIMNPNQLVAFLEKPCAEFTKEDIKRYIQQNGIRMVNFMYPAGDGRLKTLNFVINNQAYLDAILTCGERVDGSSLFPFIEAGSSDLYVIPRFRTAFLDPFAEIPTLSMLCSFFNKDGEPLESSPEHTLHKACKAFNEVTGMEFQAMGELEYYVIAPDTNMFEATDQKGYHESAPYAKFNDFRTQCMAYIAQAGGQIKYGHSEVGNFTLNGMIYEQNEIEFLPVNAEDAADQLMIAKWIIRNLAYKHGYNITFAPKITTGKAGSGLHIHMRIMKDGQNQMLKEGVLSETARKAIAGMMELAPSITAFGNTNPTSYFRLVPHQEAPTNICWGDRNRSVLVRVTEPPFPRRGLLRLLFSNRSSIRDKYIILENNYLIIIPFNLRLNGIFLIRRSISRHYLRLRNRPILCALYILPERCHPSLSSHFNRSRCRFCLHDRSSRNSR